MVWEPEGFGISRPFRESGVGLYQDLRNGALALENYLNNAEAVFLPARPQGLWLLGAHPPDPLPERLAPLDSPDGILKRNYI